MIARPTAYSPEPVRCPTCDRRCRDHAEASDCRRAHDAEEWVEMEERNAA